jgi:tetratricopeptide (TPR) repeat protein
MMGAIATRAAKKIDFCIIRRAVRSPITTDQAIAIAFAHHNAGRFAEAEGIYRQVISCQPNHAQALDMLGVLLLQSGRAELAEGFFRRALKVDAAHANYHCNLGSCLRRLGKGDEALAEYSEAIRLKPDLAVAHNNLGIALCEQLRFDEAIAAYRRAVEIQPNYADAHSNLANALRESGHIALALSACRWALNIDQNNAAAWNNFGVTLVAAGQHREAIAAYRRAIALHPTYGDAWSNLGNALALVGDHAGALEASRRAIEVEPNLVQSHWNYAVILLRSGDLRAGFAEYEWRWKWQIQFPRPSPRFYPPRVKTPHWTGADIAGKTMFIHAEQGFGDTLHFCRYAAFAAKRGAKVILEVQPELHRLMQSLAGMECVLARGEVVPSFDVHCPVMSLPLGFGTTRETVPGEVPYLAAPEGAIEQWRETLGPGSGKKRVGLCWAGSPNHADDCDRSLALAQFAALARPDVEYHSLQIGVAAGQASLPPSGMTVIDHSARLADFAETAALISQLDLVITADTAVAHVAGAIGKPVWVLLRYLSDWRWLIDREDTPWYPTMRLFRQKERGSWQPVIERIAAELAKF